MDPATVQQIAMILPYREIHQQLSIGFSNFRLEWDSELQNVFAQILHKIDT